MKSKKIFLSIIALTLIISGSFYFYLKSKKAAQDKAVNWITKHGGFFVIKPHPLIEKYPKKLDFLKSILGERMVSMGLAPNSPIPFSGNEYNSPLENTNLPLNDISLIKHLTSLETISINDLSISDISALKYLTNLTSLDLAFTRVTDLSALKNLRNLTSIRLTSTEVADLSPLKGLTKLENLELALTDVTTLDALYSLQNLKSLDLSCTPVTFEQIKKLQSKLPSCKIDSNLSYNPNEDFSYIVNFFGRKVHDLSMFETIRMNGVCLLLIEVFTSKDFNQCIPIIYRSKDSPEEQAIDLINLSFNNSTIGEIIYGICKAKGLKYKIEKHAITLYHPSTLSDAEKSQSKLNLSPKEIPRLKYKSLEEELRKIIIPEVTLKDAEFDFVIDCLKTKSKEHKPDKSIPLNFISGFYLDKKINLQLKSVSLKELLDQVCSLLKISYEINSRTVIFRPQK